MKPINMTDDKAEAELLELIRLQDAKDFTLFMSCSDGHWTIAMEDLDGCAGRSVGESECYPAAWFGVTPGSVR